MSYQNITLQSEGEVVVLTISRPQVRNAIDRATVLELRSALEAVRADPTARVLILTGGGDKAFVAGADLNALRTRGVLETYYNENQTVFSLLQEIDQITIAAVNGLALGGGCELAMACDLRIASTRAKFAQTELMFGFLPGAGGTQRLPRLVGMAKAKQMILTGEVIDARTALEIGLVNQVVEPEGLMDAARETAQTILARAPLAVKMAKRVMNHGAQLPLDSALALERSIQAVLFSTKDHIEGIDAFFEKRKPEFTGE